MNRWGRLFSSLLVAGGVLFAAPGAAAPGDEPPPPTDAEIAKFVAVQNALVADPGRADEICALGKGESGNDGSGDRSLAAAGRKIEANAITGPLVRRQGLTGQRYAQVTMHVAAGLLGLAIADDADRDEPKPNGVGPNRAALLRNSPAARVVAPRQAELTELFGRLEAFCASDDAESEEEYE